MILPQHESNQVTVQKKRLHTGWFLLMSLLLACQSSPQPGSTNDSTLSVSPSIKAGETPSGDLITLPPPHLSGTMSVEETLAKRRTVRSYTDTPITLVEISQLLWAAQGITEPTRGLRTTPSAGATYPLETYILVNNSNDLTPGIYKYLPQGHKLQKIRDKTAAEWLNIAAAAAITFTVVYERTTKKYGKRGEIFAAFEVGHAAENVCLEAIALGLDTGVMGAFDEQQVRSIFKLPAEEVPVYMVRLGHRQG